MKVNTTSKKIFDAPRTHIRNLLIVKCYKKKNKHEDFPDFKDEIN